MILIFRTSIKIVVADYKNLQLLLEIFDNPKKGGRSQIVYLENS